MLPDPRLTARFAAAAALAFATACGSQPLGPTPVDQGIVVYLHSDFRGTSQQVGADVADLGKAEGPCQVDENGGGGSWNDCISSIRVLPGWRARIYGDKNFRGAALDVTADIPDLDAVRGECSGSYNDCISSIRVSRIE
jgi:hypothetical protein